ncbi:MAG: maltotransferase domain-containing protein [Acidimicrobiales bacterium]
MIPLGRIAIDDVRPSTPSGEPAKTAAGEELEVSCDLVTDGHDVLAGRLRWHHVDDEQWSQAPLVDVGNDRWQAVVTPENIGAHELAVEAWKDRWGTWLHGTAKKLEAGDDVAIELEDGALLLEERHDPQLASTVAELRDPGLDQQERFERSEHPAVGARMVGPQRPSDLVTSPSFPLWVDRERAAVGAWYEFFPRSEGGLVGSAKRLHDVAAMGFDVVYFPPVHPIGRSHRKGPGNTLVAGPEDPGSPWAIGSDEGGHTELHPELGTLKDFASLVQEARSLGLEIALDYALQCSPDHPWVTEHPTWFHHRSDGSVAYAENPPKKYQDIYPINFWPDDEADRLELWTACRDILETWIARGVTIFRVDNPHTKPLAFWQWVLADVRSRHPETIYLAEAFTRPKMMARLAEVGFSQSYTYFTWRVEAWELGEYLTELSEARTSDYMRPAFWTNTPDILSGPLRDGPPAAFRLRALMAATMTPTWGVYSGFEFCENVPASPENEEYFASEKFELKRREWGSPTSLAPFLGALNALRRRHPALRRTRGARVHLADNPQLFAYSRMTRTGDDVVLVVVNLDPWNVQSGYLQLDLAELGLPPDSPYHAVDELTGESYEWSGPSPWVRLDPAAGPGHVLSLSAGAG